MNNRNQLYHGYRFSPDIISHDVGKCVCLRRVGFDSGLPLCLCNLLIILANNLRSTACKAVYGAECGPVRFRPQPPSFWVAVPATINTNGLRRKNNKRKRACRGYLSDLFFNENLNTFLPAWVAGSRWIRLLANAGTTTVLTSIWGIRWRPQGDSN
jgi:hypothetical protein